MIYNVFVFNKLSLRKMIRKSFNIKIYQSELINTRISIETKTLCVPENFNN